MLHGHLSADSPRLDHCRPSSVSLGLCQVRRLLSFQFPAHQPSNAFHLDQDLDQVIVSVALVKPVPGVFIDQIQHMLVIATPSEITLVGLAFQGKNYHGQAQIFHTQLSVSSDNVTINDIVGTSTGRIFLSGNNGQLYELIYHQQSSGNYFQRKCRKLNHSASALDYFLPSFFSWRSDSKKQVAIKCNNWFSFSSRCQNRTRPEEKYPLYFEWTITNRCRLLGTRRSAIWENCVECRRFVAS